MFSTLPKINFNFSVTFILLSANAFNLDQSKICRLVKSQVLVWASCFVGCVNRIFILFYYTDHHHSIICQQPLSIYSRPCFNHWKTGQWLLFLSHCFHVWYHTLINFGILSLKWSASKSLLEVPVMKSENQIKFCHSKICLFSSDNNISFKPLINLNSFG